MLTNYMLGQTCWKINKCLKLTSKGVEKAKYIADRIDDVLNKASECLSEEKRAIMCEGLELISKNLDKLCEKYDEK